MMVYPSALLGIAVGLLVWLFLTRAGETPEQGELARIRGQIAYRVLSVKLMALNGEVDDGAVEVHYLATADQPENSVMRALLRDAGGVTPDHWQSSARAVGSIYGPEDLLSRLNDLVVQVTAQPACVPVDGHSFHLDEAVQVRIMEIAKMWKIGPNRTRRVLEDSSVILSDRLLAWK
jgi:hypothetical protein